ncbi:MAG: hypothetical protein MUC35_04030 [Candidatus Margulisbacteria bacterium]|jgi:nitrogen fixation protein FixH|nr:hypothetical protein [Candidatus Margulisiibacteriota bacterium]
MLLRNPKPVLLLIFGLLGLIFVAYSIVWQVGGKTAISDASNRKILLGTDHYFTYQFNQRPVLGTNILKVQIFKNDGTKTVLSRITGASGMPAMGSSHDSAEQDFTLNKKNDYLLPIDLVMPGDWVIHLTFYQGKIEYGRHTIKIII